MKIQIKKNAKEMYIADNTDFEGNYFGNDQWEQVMEKIAGKVIEVDTEQLFKHEFNTKPIEGVSEEGIRIMEEYVDKVIDDIRKGKAHCDFCNETSDSDKICTRCGRVDYLEPFVDEYEYEE
ncbi:hypothetical protein [Priestia aryabhattai]|uniref:hypothetical protein n=1 Tax=Priestia aryabhattai TaxID=412384 RepID=UPI002E1AFF00|nr:hypothetical protein [Priestia aryabhattai]